MPNLEDQSFSATIEPEPYQVQTSASHTTIDCDPYIVTQTRINPPNASPADSTSDSAISAGFSFSDASSTSSTVSSSSNIRESEHHEAFRKVGGPDQPKISIDTEQASDSHCCGGKQTTIGQSQIELSKRDGSISATGEGPFDGGHPNVRLLLNEGGNIQQHLNNKVTSTNSTSSSSLTSQSQHNQQQQQNYTHTGNSPFVCGQACCQFTTTTNGKQPPASSIAALQQPFMANAHMFYPQVTHLMHPPTLPQPLGTWYPGATDPHHHHQQQAQINAIHPAHYNLISNFPAQHPQTLQPTINTAHNHHAQNQPIVSQPMINTDHQRYTRSQHHAVAYEHRMPPAAAYSNTAYLCPSVVNSNHHYQPPVYYYTNSFDYHLNTHDKYYSRSRSTNTTNESLLKLNKADELHSRNPTPSSQQLSEPEELAADNGSFQCSIECCCDHIDGDCSCNCSPNLNQTEEVTSSPNLGQNNIESKDNYAASTVSKETTNTAKDEAKSCQGDSHGESSSNLHALNHDYEVRDEINHHRCKHEKQAQQDNVVKLGQYEEHMGDVMKSQAASYQDSEATKKISSSFLNQSKTSISQMSSSSPTASLAQEDYSQASKEQQDGASPSRGNSIGGYSNDGHQYDQQSPEDSMGIVRPPPQQYRSDLYQHGEQSSAGAVTPPVKETTSHQPLQNCSSHISSSNSSQSPLPSSTSPGNNKNLNHPHTIYNSLTPTHHTQPQHFSPSTVSPILLIPPAPLAHHHIPHYIQQQHSNSGLYLLRQPDYHQQQSISAASHYYLQLSMANTHHLYHHQQQTLEGLVVGNEAFHYPQMISQYHTAQPQQLVNAPTAIINCKQQIPRPYFITQGGARSQQQMSTYYPTPYNMADYMTNPVRAPFFDSTTCVSAPFGHLVPQRQLSPSKTAFYQQQHLHNKSGDTRAMSTSPMIAFSQMRSSYNLISMLPIDACPTRTRQAYGMDKVWRDEFEQLFSQLVTNVVWTLIEVDSNPSIRDSSDIIGYKGRYLVRFNQNVTGGQAEDALEIVAHESCCAGVAEEKVDCDDDIIQEACNDRADAVQPMVDIEIKTDLTVINGEPESDCDSGAQLDSTSGSGSSTGATSEPIEMKTISDSSEKELVAIDENKTGPKNDTEKTTIISPRKFPTRFRMFIDSAKVRFCCDHCGHGWTSMKGRVVFWYELFELVDIKTGDDFDNGDWINGSGSGSNLIGYCTYKLFGQQCDVCKIENRFERPMWYPEEVCKVLNNLYNKIGQIYFGFKMPTMDKQRRAGKPKTSHNSSLCQACHDGVCTDRK